MSDNRNQSSRRDFLKTAAAGAAGTGVVSASGTAVEAAHGGGDAPDIEVDVAIVGGGVAGCYAAYRLLSSSASDFRPEAPAGGLKSLYANGNKPKVAIFEYAGRAAGRLLSPEVPGIGSAYTSEFGGFRFHHQMEIVWQTANNLLKLDDEVFNYEGQEEQKNNVVYVRGVQLTRSQVDSGFISPQAGTDGGKYKNAGPYNVASSEVGMSPGDLQTLVNDLAMQNVLPDYSQLASGPYRYPDPSDPSTTLTLTLPAGFKNLVVVNDKNADANSKVKLPAEPNGWSTFYNLFHYQYNVVFNAVLKGESPKPSDSALLRQIAELYESAKEQAKPGGRPLADWSWWNLKRHFLSQEANAAIEDCGGYNSLFATGNAPWNFDEDFYFAISTGPLSTPTNTPPDRAHPDVESSWRHIKDGYAAIPDGLYHKFLAAGGASYLNYQLISFDHPADPPKEGNYKGKYYDLVFNIREPGRGLARDASGIEYAAEVQELIEKEDASNGPGDQQPVPEQDQVTLKTVRAKFLVLAMPKRSLERIDQRNFFFQNSRVRKLLNSVVNVDAIRFFLAYDNPWWQNSPFYKSQKPPVPGQIFPNGRSTTDLGLRQFYYWYTPAPDAPNQKSLVLASYASGQAEAYWRPLQEGQPYDNLLGAIGPNLFGTKPNAAAAQFGGPRHASVTMAEEAHRQMMEVHGVTSIADAPPPYYAHFQNWTKNPWGAGWHSWAANSDQQLVIPRVRQPIQPDPQANLSPAEANVEENIYIIGECYSDVQGWVQGALNSAEALAQCNWRLKWPSWLDRYKYVIWLGPGTKWIVPGESDDPCLPLSSTVDS